MTENEKLLDDFRKSVKDFCTYIGTIRSDFGGEVVGITMKASSTIRRGYTIKRCWDIINERKLPFKIKSTQYDSFSIILITNIKQNKNEKTSAS